MAIADTLHKIATAATDITTLHQSSKYLAQNIGNIRKSFEENPERIKEEFDFNIPKEAIVDTVVKCYGYIKPYDVVEIYSHDEFIKKVFANSDGYYFGNLIFSKVGEYEMYAVHSKKYQSNTKYIDIIEK